MCYCLLTGVDFKEKTNPIIDINNNNKEFEKKNIEDQHIELNKNIPLDLQNNNNQNTCFS